MNAKIYEHTMNEEANSENFLLFFGLFFPTSMYQKIVGTCVLCAERKINKFFHLAFVYVDFNKKKL